MTGSTSRGPAAARRLPLLMLLFAACSDQITRDGSDRETGWSPAPGDASPSRAGTGGFLTPGTVVIDQDRSRIMSSPDEMAAGIYRYQDTEALLDGVSRDDVILQPVNGSFLPRRVLASRSSGDVRVIETGPAIWSDAIAGGTYGLFTSIGGSPAARPDPEKPTPSSVVAMPILSGSFSLDICGLVDSLASISGLVFRLCNDPHDTEFDTRYFSVEAEGTIDSLAINNASVEVSGGFATDFSIDPGGVEGGSPPVFAPCNRGSFPGCLATPTGANLIDWMKKHAPSIPDGALPAVRICVPGTQVRVKAGRFEGLRWIPATYEKCRITSTGTLPKIIPPSLEHATAVTRLRLTGQLTLDVVGSGKFKLEVPIPKLGWSKDTTINAIKTEVAAGLFIEAELELLSASASLHTSLDEEVEIRQTWTPQSGWDLVVNPIRTGQSVDVDVDNPDSVRVRLFVPKVKVESGLSLELPRPLGDGFKLERTEHFAAVGELVWTREQVHPTDPDIDNWHLSQDGYYELVSSKKLELPDIFPDPRVPLSYEDRYEFGRVRVADAWGITDLEIETVQVGEQPTSEDYGVVIRRADTLPRLAAPGAVRDGPAIDWGSPIHARIPHDESILLEPGGLRCGIGYSDAQAGVWKVAIRNATGLAIPNYFKVNGDCNLLVAEHEVELVGVEPWCTVEGGAVRHGVWPRQRRRALDRDENETTKVTFKINCGTPQEHGAIAVTALYPANPSTGVILELDGVSQGPIADGETRTLTGLLPGQHHVALSGSIPWCHLTSEDIAVVPGDTTEVTLVGVCFQPLVGQDGILLAIDHSGAPAPLRFTVMMDGEQAIDVAPGLPELVAVDPSYTPSVFMITDLPDNCRVTSGNPMTGAAGTTTMIFTNCTASPITAIAGIVSPVGGAAAISAASGTVTVTGPLRAELDRLAGRQVRAWGVQSGAWFDVFGYQLLASGNGRVWSGILVNRDGKYLLISTERVELLDPPGGIRTLVGSMIWVGGDETEPGSGKVIPEIWGVTREGA